jgi:hypothetical protein
VDFNIIFYRGLSCPSMQSMRLHVLWKRMRMRT